MANFELQWQVDPHPEKWDQALGFLGGHPLQSALWGDAREMVDGIHQEKHLVLHNDIPVWMARIESRVLPVLGKVAWIPRGPTWSDDFSGMETIEEQLGMRLKQADYFLLVEDAWRCIDASASDATRKPKTIWIDLDKGRDSVWKKLDKQWRYGVGRAERLGVVVSMTSNEDEVSSFFQLCLQVSQVKGFDLPASLELMKKLLSSGTSVDVEARLFAAYYQGELGAGAFVLRCGKSLHYIWGATDRRFSKQRMGESVQWAAIGWGIDKGCKLYDLEGIDPKNNPGVYKFKKKMGGEEVLLAGKSSKGLGVKGQIINSLVRNRL